jgi:Sec-independent protein translocase protein TatA
MGQQLGRALRELKKAGNDLTNSFNLDHEQEHKPYDYGYPSYDEQSSSYSEPTAIEAKTDLTDYTIAGQPVKDTVSHNGAVVQDHDYTSPIVLHSGTEAVGTTESTGHSKEG